MADHGAASRGQDGGHLPTAVPESAMPNRECASVNPVETA